MNCFWSCSPISGTEPDSESLVQRVHVRATATDEGACDRDKHITHAWKCCMEGSRCESVKAWYSTSVTMGGVSGFDGFSVMNYRSQLSPVFSKFSATIPSLVLLPDA